MNLLQPEHLQPRDSVQGQKTLNAEKAQNRKCCCLCRVLYKAFLTICPPKKESEPNPPPAQAFEARMKALQTAGLI